MRLEARLPVGFPNAFENGLLYIVLAVLAREPLWRGVPTGSSDILTGESTSGRDGPRADGARLKESRSDAGRMDDVVSDRYRGVLIKVVVRMINSEAERRKVLLAERRCQGSRK